MENEQQQKYWFFGSKLNTALLLVLIVLMVVALRWMYQDKERYLGIFNKTSDVVVKKTKDNQDSVREYNKDGVSFNYANTFEVGPLMTHEQLKYNFFDLISSSGGLINFQYAKVKSEGARNMFGCFELPNTKIIIGSYEGVWCDSQAEPVRTYAFTANGRVFNIHIDKQLLDSFDLQTIKVQ